MESKKLQVTIASVGEAMYDGEAESIIVPGTDGQMQVLANHEPFISTLKEGTIVVENAEQDPSTGSGLQKQEFKIPGGVLEVSENQATVLVS